MVQEREGRKGVPGRDRNKEGLFVGKDLITEDNHFPSHTFLSVPSSEHDFSELVG